LVILTQHIINGASTFGRFPAAAGNVAVLRRFVIRQSYFGWIETWLIDSKRGRHLSWLGLTDVCFTRCSMLDVADVRVAAVRVCFRGERSVRHGRRPRCRRVNDSRPQR